MALDGLALAGKGHVHKVPVQLEISQGRDDVRLVVVPFQTKVFIGHDGNLLLTFSFFDLLTNFIYWYSLH